MTQERAKKWWILTAVACGTFMATLDSSIVNIALPTLTKELNSDLVQVKWVVVAYLLAITCLVLPFGRVADIYGRKRIFENGFSLFTLGSLLCSLPDSLSLLVAARVLQAVGAAMLMANGPAIITAGFPANERGKALGVMAMVVSAGLISGPSLGGLLITQLGWRSIFWVNVPVGLLGMLLVEKSVAPDKPTRQRLPFDWAGAVLQTCLMLSFVVTFDPPRFSETSGPVIHASRGVMALITIFFGLAFVRAETKAKAPLLDLSLLNERTFWTANLASFLMFVSLSSITVLMPFFLEEVLGMRTQTAGFFMTAIPVTILLVAPISGRLSDRFGSHWLSIAGAAVGGAGLFWLAGVFGAGVHAGTSSAALIAGLSLVGLSTGLFQSPNNSAIMGSVPPSKLGIASALLATVRNLGLVTGTGVSTGLFAWRMSVSQRDFTSSIHFAFLSAGLVAFAAMIAGFGRKAKKPHRGLGS